MQGLEWLFVLVGLAVILLVIFGLVRFVKWAWQRDLTLRHGSWCPWATRRHPNAKRPPTGAMVEGRNES